MAKKTKLGPKAEAPPQSMKTLITGTKYPHNLEYLLDRYNITSIITGNKKGVEQSAREYADNRNLPMTIYDNIDSAIEQADSILLIYPNKHTINKTEDFKGFKLILYKPD